MFVGLGFLVLVYGMNNSNGIQTGVIWIMLIYLLHTIGELCLSPVGLSSVTKLSPQRIVGMMMGMWLGVVMIRLRVRVIERRNFGLGLGVGASSLFGLRN